MMAIHGEEEREEGTHTGNPHHGLIPRDISERLFVFTALQEKASQAAFKDAVLTQWDDRSRTQEADHLAKVGWPNQPGTLEYKAQELKLFADNQLRKTEWTLNRTRAKVATLTANPTGHQARSAGRRAGRITSQGVELKLSAEAQELVDIDQRKANKQFEIVREALLNAQRANGRWVVLPSDAEVAKVLARIKAGKTGFDD